MIALSRDVHAEHHFPELEADVSPQFVLDDVEEGSSGTADTSISREMERSKTVHSVSMHNREDSVSMWQQYPAHTRSEAPCSKLPAFVESVFLLALANSIFLDAVWWLILRPRAEPSAPRRFSTYLLHGPINVIMGSMEVLIGTIRARRAALVMGSLYLALYFLFAFMYHQARGEWLYFFLNPRSRRNWFILIGLVSWYYACYALIFLVVAARDWMKVRLALRAK
jgi:hypothetical protein